MEISSILEYFNLNIHDNIKLFLILGSTTGLGIFTYFTVKVLVNHRKYSHIPGPKNNGYFSFNNFNRKKLSEYK